MATVQKSTSRKISQSATHISTSDAQKFKNLKDAFLSAFEEIGGVESLAIWAAEPRNRSLFYKMLAAMLPKDMNVSVEGMDDLAQAIREARERSTKYSERFSLLPDNTLRAK